MNFPVADELSSHRISFFVIVNTAMQDTDTNPSGLAGSVGLDNLLSDEHFVLSEQRLSYWPSLLDLKCWCLRGKHVVRRIDLCA